MAREGQGYPRRRRDMMMMMYYIHVYIYHTITDVCTTALLPTKPSSDDDSGFRHGFEAEASLPLTQSSPEVSHNTTWRCQIVVTLWGCHIHADAVRAFSWIFFMYFLLSDGGSPRLVKNEWGWVGNETSASVFDRKYISFPAISDTLFSQILIFFQLTLMCSVEIFFKRDRWLNNENFLLLQRTKWQYLDALS